MTQGSNNQRKIVFAWSMYDFANSSFTTLIVTFIYASYFIKAMAPDEIIGTVLWSRGVSISAITVALLSPIMGALADRGGYRKRFLFILTVVSVISSSILYFIYPGQILKALVCFVIGNIAFELGGVFYNAFLPDIAPREKIGRISGYGWSLGYVGGLLAMFVAMIGFVNPDKPWFDQTQNSPMVEEGPPVWSESSLEDIRASTGFQVWKEDGRVIEIRGVELARSGSVDGVRIYSNDGVEVLGLEEVDSLGQVMGIDLVEEALKSGNNIRATNLLVAVWFALFSLPIFLWIREDKSRVSPPGEPIIRRSFQQLSRTFHEMRQYRQIMRLLLARLLYNDGLVTIFAFGGIYAAGTFGFTFQEIMIFGIVLNIAAGIGAFAFGFLDDLLGGKKTIQISLWALALAGIIAVVAPGKAFFWLAGILVGIFSGPNQAASRSLMGRFVPPDKENEFFGFFAFSGKATAFLGPMILGLLTQAFGTQRAGISIVIVFFLLGGLILRSVNEKEGVRLAGRD